MNCTNTVPRPLRAWLIQRSGTLPAALSALIVLSACGGKSRHDDRDHRDAEATGSIRDGASDEDAGIGGELGDASTSRAGSDAGATTADSTGSQGVTGPLVESSSSSTPGEGETSGTTAPDGSGDNGSGDNGSGDNGSGAAEDTVSDAIISDSSGGTTAPVLLPEGCEATSQIDKPESCSLSSECEFTSDVTQCIRSSSGRWECWCSFHNGNTVFELEGVEGLAACAAASTFCDADELEVGEEECEADGTDDDNSCDLSLSCGRALEGDFGPGIKARLKDGVTTYCSRSSSDEPFDCECPTLTEPIRHAVLADSAADACGAFAEYCHGAELTPVDEPETCTTDYESSNLESCELVEICTTPVGTIRQTTITEVEPRGSYCSPSGETTSRCYCSGVDSTFAFEVETDDSSCATTSLVCNNDAEIQATDEPECAPTSVFTSEGSCTADLHCTQPATVDGRPLNAEGRLVLYCRQAALGQPWWCSCTSDQQSAIFEYGAANEAPWEVCAVAPTSCLEHMDVHLGAYGDFLDPPDPLVGMEVD